MDPAEIQAMLRAGIQALRAGDRARGRRLLLDVVTADERQEPAWLWLAEALDDPADQIMALENALALNPGNAPARRRLEQLRGLAGASPAPAEPAAPAPVETPAETSEPAAAPAALTLGVDPDDDPLLCPFCGQITAEADERCPHCRRSLLAPGRWQAGCYLYGLLILLGLNAQGAVVQAALPIMVESLAGQIDLSRVLALVGLGNGLVDVPFWALAFRALLLGGLLVLFLNDAQLSYKLGAGLLALDLAGVSAATGLGWLPPRLFFVNVGLTAPAWLLTLAALVSQQLARRRLYTTLDLGLHGSLDYHKRGREHARAGRLALAAPHFQKAVLLAPKVIGYYKDLAAVQAQLKRYNKARQTLQAGAQRAPHDPDFPRLLAEIERAQSAPPRPAP